MFSSRQWSSTDPHAISHNSGKLNASVKNRASPYRAGFALSAGTTNWKLFFCTECHLFSDTVIYYFVPRLLPPTKNQSGGWREPGDEVIEYLHYIGHFSIPLCQSVQKTIVMRMHRSYIGSSPQCISTAPHIFSCPNYDIRARGGGGGGVPGVTTPLLFCWGSPDDIAKACATIFAKTDHSAPILDFELLVPRCSTLIALCNGNIRIAIAQTDPSSTQKNGVYATTRTYIRTLLMLQPAPSLVLPPCAIADMCKRYLHTGTAMTPNGRMGGGASEWQSMCGHTPRPTHHVGSLPVLPAE